MENSSFVSDSEIESYVRSSFGELVDLCIETAGEQVLAVVTPVHTTTAGTREYLIYSDLPKPPEIPGDAALIYKILVVQVKLNGRWQRIRRMRLQDTASTAGRDGTWESANNIYYRVYFADEEVWTSGNSFRGIAFYPSPPGGQEFRVFYIPYPSASRNHFNFLSGWDEYVVVDAAAKVLEKEESSAVHLYRRKAELTDRIRFHAATLNLDEPDQIRDVNLDRPHDWWDWGY